jgi:hypothetical protein
MDELLKYLEAIKSKMNFRDVMFRIGNDREILEFVIHLNTRDPNGAVKGQLYDLGIDATGRRLDEIGGGYSDYTIQFFKIPESLPYDRVTLFQTGEFYESFVARVIGAGDIEIIADPIKDQDNLEDRYGNQIIGLTKESLEKLTQKLHLELEKYLINEVFKLR